MVFFNYTTMQMTAKIVYYGPGLCGKTTNLHTIHHKTAPKSRGEMVSLETETDRTLFFDLLPLEVGVIGGMRVRLQLYTVPGQVFYNATRKLVLKGVDGVVFVADSQVAALDTNQESLGNLKENLAELNLSMDTIPVVFQYNKRDIRNILPVEALNEALNPGGKPHFEAAALHGIGVFETLKEISRQAITSVRKKVEAEDPRRKAPKPAAAAAAPEPPLAAPAAAIPPPPPAPPVSIPDIAPIALPGPDEVVPVEFAEEDAEKHVVRAVTTKPSRDIHDELAKLRKSASRGADKSQAPKPAGPKGLDRRLKDMLATDQGPRVELKRKAAVELSAAVLQAAGNLKIHFVFEGEGLDYTLRDAVVVRLARNPKLETVSLQIELDLKPRR